MGEIRTFQGELRVKGKSENLKGVKEIYYKSILKVSLVNRTNLIKENVSEYSANYQNSVNIIDIKNPNSKQLISTYILRYCFMHSLSSQVKQDSNLPTCSISQMLKSIKCVINQHRFLYICIFLHN